MRIKGINNLKKFFNAVHQCSGEVELITNDGNKLNLKSTLCQYIAITQMFDDDADIQWQLSLSNDKDLELLKPFIIE